MSFMNSGAECSTSRNPLSQFTKHTLEDRSHQHERFAPGATNQANSMRSANQPMNSTDRQMMSQFMNGETAQPATPFAFDQIRHELNNVPVANKGWATDFSANQVHSRSSPMPGIEANVRTGPGAVDSRWGSEFSVAQPGGQQQQNFYGASGTGYMPQMNMYSSGLMSGASSATTLTQQNRIQELDDKHWEEQFRQIEESAAVKEEVQLDKGKSVTEEVIDEAAEREASDKTDFEAVWSNLKRQIFENPEHDWVGDDRTAAWDRDFDQFTRNRPDYGQYEFEENNQFMNQNDPFTIGVQIVESGGNLSEAALAFEAAVQKDSKHAEAWSRLGSVQAQNEKESSAIRALERCIELEPGNLTALMNLAVAYTNESYENAAYSTLEKWIATKYPDIVSQVRSDGSNSHQLHSRVTDLFLKAAQLSPNGANIDASVQDGLGVLFYGNEEYEKAIDCFRAALAVSPNDPLLWNRLGATLANSQRSEEAIDAYEKALALRPFFVRARYNLGVSCINIGCYHEAAQHLLTALSMNTVEGSSAVDVLANQSTNLLSTLKRTFLALNRKDLAEKVGNGMDLNTFRQEFDF